MPFYTPNGLKIRFDPDAVAFVLLKQGHTYETIDMHDIQLNTELWINLPNATSNVLTILVAVQTESWMWSLLAAFSGYILGYLISNVSYSPMLRRIVPQFLGSWIIALTASAIVSIIACGRSNWILAVLVPLVVIVNWFHYSDLLQLFLLPIGILFRRSVGIGVGWSEFAFISACNEAACRTGVQLDWSFYGDAAEIGKEFQSSKGEKG
jgi:hypothetical protein